jgi:hypothetical protein
MSLALPPYATFEVTEDPFFRGGSLSRVKPDELEARLAAAALAPPAPAAARVEARS